MICGKHLIPAILLSLILIIGTGSAAPSQNNSNEIVHIMQGQCVALGSYYDISGIGWNNGAISYFGRWYDDFTAGTNSSLVARVRIPYEVKALSKYYIDPKVFGDKLGYWYMEYEEYEEAGNSRLFFVNTTCPAIIKAKPTVTSTVAPSETSQYPLPQKHESDILLARGDPFSMKVSTPSTYWLIGFDKDHSLYDKTAMNGQLTITDKELMYFDEGSYTLSLITPGENTLIEEHYESGTQEIVSPLRSVANVSIKGLQPKVVEELLKKQVDEHSDDIITAWDIAFQDPKIYIEDMQENAANTALTIRGYTNVAIDTYLTLKVDGKKVTSTQALDGGGPGYWRQYSVSVPFDLKNMKAGEHTIEISCPEGGGMTVTPYIREEQPDSYQPEKYLKYVDNSPFIPTPTPEIQKVAVPGPTQYITVTITPSTSDWDQYAAAQQRLADKKKAEDDAAFQSMAAWYAIIGAIIIGAGYFAWSMYRARKRAP